MIGAKAKLRELVGELQRAAAKSPRLRTPGTQTPAYVAGYNDGAADGESAGLKKAAGLIISRFKLTPPARKVVRIKRKSK